MVVIVWELDLQLPMETVTITTNSGSSKPMCGEVYTIQYYVMKFVGDLRQIGGFLQGTPVSIINKSDRHEITEILLKVALNTTSVHLSSIT